VLLIGVKFGLFSISLIDLVYKLSIEKPSIYCKHTYYYYRPECYYYMFPITFCRFLPRQYKAKNSDLHLLGEPKRVEGEQFHRVWRRKSRAPSL